MLFDAIADLRKAAPPLRRQNSKSSEGRGWEDVKETPDNVSNKKLVEVDDMEEVSANQGDDDKSSTSGKSKSLKSSDSRESLATPTPKRLFEKSPVSKSPKEFTKVSGKKSPTKGVKKDPPTKSPPSSGKSSGSGIAPNKRELLHLNMEIYDLINKLKLGPQPLIFVLHFASVILVWVASRALVLSMCGSPRSKDSSTPRGVAAPGPLYIFILL